MGSEDRRGSRPIWAVPALLLVILLGFLGYRYRWIAPALRPVQDVEFHVQVRLDQAKGEVVVTVDNYQREALRIQFDELTWNEAPMRTKLPPEEGVAPYAQRTWRFSPIDPRVADYGDQVEVYYRAGYGVMEASTVSDGTFEGAPGGSAFGSGKGLTIGVWVPEHHHAVEVRNPEALIDGKVVKRATGVHRIEPGNIYIIGTFPAPKGEGTIGSDLEYRRTPWSPWRTPPR